MISTSPLSSDKGQSKSGNRQIQDKSLNPLKEFSFSALLKVSTASEMKFPQIWSQISF